MILFAAAATAALVFFLMVLLVIYARHSRRRDMFYRLEKQMVLGAQKRPERQMAMDWLKELLAKAAAPIVGWKPVQALDTKMRQAGIPLLGGEFLVAALAGMLLAVFLLWMLFLDVLAALGGGLLVLLLFWGIVAFRIRRRRETFTEQLGDCLTTVANALRAGYSFQQAMDVIAREMEPPISEEFAQVTREVGMSVPLDISLESMNERVGSADFDLVVTAVLIQREVGGNLAQILDTISDTINERIRMKREIFALTAQGRLSAWVLILLPFAIGLFMYCFSPAHVMLLIEDPFGRMALIGSLILELIGYIIIRRIVNIDV